MITNLQKKYKEEVVPKVQEKFNIKNIASLPEEDFWNQVRGMFPIPKDEAYFNTGTLGVLPYPVMNAVIDAIRYNAENAARTDYKGEGPLLLSGYEAFVETRKKDGQLINVDHKEISFRSA